MSDPKKQQRRLRFAKRQLALAQISRREAMAALADAVSEEARSTMLAERSADLLQDYSGRSSSDDGSTITGHHLRDNAAFVRRLADIADQASKATKDARDQAAWQAQSLAQAETKATRLQEKVSAAQKAIEDAQLIRSQTEMSGLARKLQRPSQASDAETDGA